MEEASTQQKDYLRKLEGWKGVRVDWDKVNESSREDVSALIDEFKALPSVNNKSKKVKELMDKEPVRAPKNRSEEIRIGQAFNLVWSFHAQTGEWPIKNKEGFRDQVKQVAELIKRCSE